MDQPKRIAADKPRIVVVGGGAGGAELVTALGRKFGREMAEVTLVDCAASHLWKPRLHEVAVGLISPGEDAVPFLSLGRANSFRFEMGALTGLDVAGKTISIAGIVGDDGSDLIGPRQIPYDTLILAIGSEVNNFHVEGVDEYCHMLDSAEQASAFHRRLLERAANSNHSPFKRNSILTGLPSHRATRAATPAIAGRRTAGALRKANLPFLQFDSLNLDVASVFFAAVQQAGIR